MLQKINYLQIWPAKVACRKKTLLVRNFWTPHWLDWILIFRQLVTGKCSQSGFSQTHKIGNIGIIAKFEFPYFCSFLLSLQHMILVNMKVDISACNRIKFQGCKLCKLHWSSSFLMAQLKWSWQYWHFCIVESLWKTLLTWHQTSNSHSAKSFTDIPTYIHNLNLSLEQIKQEKYCNIWTPISYLFLSSFSF